MTTVRIPTPKARLRAFRLFDRGWTVPMVAAKLGRSERTVRYWRARARAAVGIAPGDDSPRVAMGADR